MAIAIEQLIKMHDPRCMSIESLNVGCGVQFSPNSKYWQHLQLLSTIIPLALIC